MFYKIEELSSCLFTWETWRSGTITDIVPACRENVLIEYRDVIRKYAIGYCDGGCVCCRQKPGTFAVMFDLGGNRLWTHLTKKEFETIFA